MKYDPELQAEVDAWHEHTKTLGPLYAHYAQVAPRPLLDCHHCRADLRSVRSIVQTLGKLRDRAGVDRFWRWHKCPSCHQRFVSGVPLIDAVATTDVETMPKWYPAKLLARMRAAEYEQAVEDRALPSPTQLEESSHEDTNP